MIRPRFAILPLLVLLVLTPTVKAVDKDKLRRALSLPELSFIFGYGFNGWGNSSAIADLGPQPEKIAEIEKQLKGDATDAESYCLLASLYARASQPAKAKEARRQAKALLQKQIAAHPEDRTLKLRLADILDELGEGEEAGKMLQRILEDSPDDWHAYLALGQLLSDHSRRGVLNGKVFYAESADRLLQSLRAASPTPKQIAAWRRLCKEADACFDRAISLAPRAPETYRQRGLARYFNSIFACGLRLYEGEKADFTAALLAPEARADLRRAADLGSNDYADIGFIDWLDAMADASEYSARHPSAKPPEQMLDIVSEGTRQRVGQHMARLRKAMEGADSGKAAEAAEVLGFLRMTFLKDWPTTEKILRRSIELDPSRNASWEVLMAVLLESADMEKAVELCRQHLKHKDSARNRLLLAKAYAELDQLNKAEKVIRAGLKREPDDFMLNLARADLLLMRGNSDELYQAAEILGKLESDRRAGTPTENRWTNFRFACAIGHGLIGEVKQAREGLEEVRKRKPQYPHLQDALKALDE